MLRLALCVAALLLPASGLLAQEGPDPSVHESGAEEALPEGLFQLRAYYRYGFLSGNEIGDDEGFFLGDAPEADDAYRNSQGVGVDLVWWFMPLTALQFSVSYEIVQGRTVVTPVDVVEFDDLRLFKFSIGPRLNLPLTMRSNRWVDPDAVADLRGVVPYLRMGMGWGVSSHVDARLSSGLKVNYWSQSIPFHFIFAIGFEFQLKHIGFFSEFGFDTFAVLHGAREPESENWTISQAPIIFGVSWRF